MKLTIEINLDNSAYDSESQTLEIKKNLQWIVFDLEHGYSKGSIKDTNGNKTGYWRIDNEA